MARQHGQTPLVVREQGGGQGPAGQPQVLLSGKQLDVSDHREGLARQAGLRSR